ncbi:hypothetical protein HanPSC8_Chr17g0753381 [Helianthus annuus]|nr:hypothetical protein HanPSC8_Chr17g0753381 [Helianthus annuus]
MVKKATPFSCFLNLDHLVYAHHHHPTSLIILIKIDFLCDDCRIGERERKR